MIIVQFADIAGFSRLAAPDTERQPRLTDSRRTASTPYAATTTSVPPPNSDGCERHGWTGRATEQIRPFGYVTGVDGSFRELFGATFNIVKAIWYHGPWQLVAHEGLA